MASAVADFDALEPLRILESNWRRRRIRRSSNELCWSRKISKRLCDSFARLALRSNSLWYASFSIFTKAQSDVGVKLDVAVSNEVLTLRAVDGIDWLKDHVGEIFRFHP